MRRSRSSQRWRASVNERKVGEDRRPDNAGLLSLPSHLHLSASSHTEDRQTNRQPIMEIYLCYCFEPAIIYSEGSKNVFCMQVVSSARSG